MKTVYSLVFLLIRMTIASAQTITEEKSDSSALFNKPVFVQSLDTLVRSSTNIVSLLDHGNESLMQKFIATLENETSLEAISRFCLCYDLDSAQLLQSIRLQLSVIERLYLSVPGLLEPGWIEAVLPMPLSVSPGPGIDASLLTRYFTGLKAVTGSSDTELPGYIIAAFHSIHNFRVPVHNASLSINGEAGCQWIMTFCFKKCF